MRLQLGVSLTLCILFSSFAATAHSADTYIVLTSDVQLRIADAFMDEGEYYRAVTEYKKFLILFPDLDQSGYVLFRIGMAYYKGEEYESSVRSFASLRQKHGEGPYASQSYYYEGLSQWKLKKYETARTSFQALVNDYPQSELAPMALVADSLVALDMEKIDDSIRQLERLRYRYPEYPKSRTAPEAIRMLERYQNLPAKSETLAGAMSAVLPGSGYFYAGHYSDGVTAFLISGLSIAGTVFAFQQENYAVAGVVGGVGLPFYLGNIYGSANAARKWNIGVREELRNNISLTLDFQF
jgi:tetratricopeptide (TPR) repeat protein